MFLNKVQDQKVELLRAAFRNMYLKEKCEYLDSECKMLAEHILTSQISGAEKTEIKTTLEKELESLRQQRDQKMHELAGTNEQMMSMSIVLENSKSSISNSLNENKSINDELDMKNDMIKCLQEELVHVRLAEAEKWALIRELRQIKDELEKDKEMLTKTKPETIARLQDELITARLLETQYSLDFNNIKGRIEKMKLELAAHKQQVKDGKSEGNVKITKKGILWLSNDKNDEEINDILADIKTLEKEKAFLVNRIPELRSKIDILDKHIQFKEKERCRLQETLESTNLKYKSFENITQERKRQYAHLETSASEKVSAIRNSCKEKNQNIDELSSKLQEVSERRSSTTKKLTIKELNTIHALQNKILALKQKINQLNSETMKLHQNDCCEEEEENMYSI